MWRRVFFLIVFFSQTVFAGDHFCGVVSTFFDGPATQDIYTAQIGAINGQNRLLEVQEHRLPPGEYHLKVYEAISAPELSVDNRHRGYSKILKVIVEANKVYRIGAKFNSKKRFDRDEFWQPVIWQVGDKSCEL